MLYRYAGLAHPLKSYRYTTVFTGALQLVGRSLPRRKRSLHIFNIYLRCRNKKRHFCRPSSPETKFAAIIPSTYQCTNPPSSPLPSPPSPEQNASIAISTYETPSPSPRSVPKVPTLPARSPPAGRRAANEFTAQKKGEGGVRVGGMENTTLD